MGPEHRSRQGCTRERKLAPRSNDDWREALKGGSEDGAGAVRELEAYLRRILGRLAPGRLAADDVGELVQESLARIVNSLGSFRGDSAFTTWATGIATRVVFTELRRRQVRDARQQDFSAVEADVRNMASPTTLPPDELVSRSQLLKALHEAIATRLTGRQRVAILAELRGIPSIEIAERMNTTQNALYKLTHDARKRLRQALLDAGFSAESLHRSALEVSP